MKYAALLLCTLMLSGCGATGTLLGTIVRLPVDVISSASRYDSTDDSTINIDNETTLNHAN